MLLASLLLPKLKHFFNRLKCLSIKYNEGIQTRYRSFIQKRGATHIRTHSVEKTAKVNERKRKPAKKQSRKKGPMFVYILYILCVDIYTE